jgi:F-type H+-transporting ATPase subunit gamma
MANIKDLKKRIKSTKGTFKITKAMKLVSAAKLSKAQSKILGLRPYSTELEQTVKTVSALNKDYTSSYFSEDKNNKRTLYLIVSSDKGLCGSYNSSIVKMVRKLVLENSLLAEEEKENFKFAFIGKKAKDLLAKELNVSKIYTFAKADPTFEEVRKIADELSHFFLTSEYGKVCVVYNSFQSAISFNTTKRQLLPMVVTEAEKEKLRGSFPYDYKYEPSAGSILDTLVPEVFVTSLYTCILDAIASEHGSRMSSMESASKNCKEMIRKLSLKMNKLRQAKITTELTEVVSGAESLNG